MANLWLSHIPAATHGQALSTTISFNPSSDLWNNYCHSRFTGSAGEELVRGSGRGRVWTRQDDPRVCTLDHGAIHLFGCCWEGSVTGQPCTFALGLGVYFSHDPA